MKFLRKVLLLLAVGAAASAAAQTGMTLKYLGHGHSMLSIDTTAKYLILPVQEAADESTVAVIVDNQLRENIKVRLAKDKIDYFMPYELKGNESFYIHAPFYDNVEAQHKGNASESGVWVKHLSLSDTYEIAEEQYRPVYHFAPAYGWMNDPNGMFYKDGEYHLYYQYNPYAAVWANMSWGHASSKDLIHWTHHPVAMRGDALGEMFSGSAVVDKNGDAGFGKDAVIAFYTAARERQMQCIAVSKDNGITFDKYENNPVVTASIPDFRDPKVVRNEKGDNWIMVLASGQEMRFYSSKNLKDWTFESTFGLGYGNHEGVWECPDLFELSVEGTDKSKWVLVCNINPGGPAGGSATQYFVGDFDGRKFTVDTPCKTKWMDYGRDHYAAVTWSGAPDGRHISLSWMNNWQYANVVPMDVISSANGLPRDLSLYEYNGDLFVKSTPVAEINAYMKPAYSKSKLAVGAKLQTVAMPKDLNGTYVISVELEKGGANSVQMALANNKGEKVVMTYTGETFSVDRNNSGNVQFSEQFPSVTACEVNSDNGTLKLQIFVDKSSVEVFGNDGRFTQSNLVFPSEPYNKIIFNTDGKKAKISNLKISKIQL